MAFDFAAGVFHRSGDRSAVTALGFFYSCSKHLRREVAFDSVVVGLGLVLFFTLRAKVFERKRVSREAHVAANAVGDELSKKRIWRTRGGGARAC